MVKNKQKCLEIYTLNVKGLKQLTIKNQLSTKEISIGGNKGQKDLKLKRNSK